MIKKANGNKAGSKAGRVVVNLTREELEFIDNIGRDALFTTGKRLTNNKIIRAFIEVMQEVKVKGDGLYNAEELKNRILVKLRIKKDKRVYSRFKKEVTLSWRKISSSEEYNRGSTIEIGEGGFRIQLKQNRKVGENLDFTINDPHEPHKPIRVFGRIVWIKKRDENSDPEAGIKITCLLDKDKARFKRLLCEESCHDFCRT
ncbi:PilZ domain-containing protein [Candidatus Omnitrophota bacterium]